MLLPVGGCIRKPQMRSKIMGNNQWWLKLTLYIHGGCHGDVGASPSANGDTTPTNQ